MQAFRPLQYFVKTALLLAVTLTLSAFLSYMVFERLHEQYFLTTTIATTDLASVNPDTNPAGSESAGQQTLIDIRDKLSAQGLPGEIVVSLAGTTGQIQNSTSPTLSGLSLPSDYQLKKLPSFNGLTTGLSTAETWRYATLEQAYNIVVPVSTSPATLLIALDLRATESGRDARQAAVTGTLVNAGLIGLLVLSLTTVILIPLSKTFIYTEPRMSRWSRLVLVCSGVLTLAAAHAALFSFVWQDIETDLTTLIGNTMATPDLSVLLFSLLTDNVTVMLIALLISIELSILLFNGRKPTPPVQPNSGNAIQNPQLYKAMRPAIFLFLFSIDLAMSILPLHMERLYTPIPGLSREFILGLPISVEFLCVGIAIFVSGAWLDRKGWVQPFACGLLLTAAGGVFSWLSAEAWQFVISRAVLGFGYGLTLLAAQGFVVSHTDSKTKTEGLAHLFAGLYSGSICGAATGAMIAERYGYDVVFIGGALMVFTVAVYAFIYLREDKPAKEPSINTAPETLTQPATSKPGISVWQFLRDPRFIAVALLSSFPAAIGVIGFLHYFTPVYLSKIGVSESQIGQTLMLYGICLTLLGPAIGRLADKATSKKLPIMVGGILASLAFLSFAGLEGIYAATVAVILLGLSGCFVLPSQSAYVLNLDVSKQYGEGKALGIFRASSRIGQMLGPIVFSAVAAMSDIRLGVASLGAIYLVTVVLFQVLAARESTVVYKMESSR